MCCVRAAQAAARLRRTLHLPDRTPPFVAAPTAPTAPAAPPAHKLKLSAALQLLRQSGCELPERREVGDAPWLQEVIDALCEISSRDPLTGLANRRQFELALASEIDRVARAGESALVLMIDIDFFKKVNDGFGHATVVWRVRRYPDKSG